MTYTPQETETVLFEGEATLNGSSRPGKLLLTDASLVFIPQPRKLFFRKKAAVQIFPASELKNCHSVSKFEEGGYALELSLANQSLLVGLSSALDFYKLKKHAAALAAYNQELKLKDLSAENLERVRLFRQMEKGEHFLVSMPDRWQRLSPDGAIDDTRAYWLSLEGGASLAQGVSAFEEIYQLKKTYPDLCASDVWNDCNCNDPLQMCLCRFFWRFSRPVFLKVLPSALCSAEPEELQRLLERCRACRLHPVICQQENELDKDCGIYRDLLTNQRYELSMWEEYGSADDAATYYRYFMQELRDNN